MPEGVPLGEEKGLHPITEADGDGEGDAEADGATDGEDDGELEGLEVGELEGVEEGLPDGEPPGLVGLELGIGPPTGELGFEEGWGLEGIGAKYPLTGSLQPLRPTTVASIMK